jgi:hypothetical protein
MMDKRIGFGQLRKVLATLGYELIRSTGGDHIVFQNPRRFLIIMLREMKEHEIVLPSELSRIRRTLVDDGVISDKESEFNSLFLIQRGDRLVWTDPKSGKETKVTAAAAESDGLVVIKQNGTLLPCPVNEVRRVERAAPAGRK